MKEIKQIIWLMAGITLMFINPPHLVNGVTVIGWIITLYTLYRIYQVQIKNYE